MREILCGFHAPCHLGGGGIRSNVDCTCIIMEFRRLFTGSVPTVHNIVKVKGQDAYAPFVSKTVMQLLKEGNSKSKFDS